jgi:hypothetical protein
LRWRSQAVHLKAKGPVAVEELSGNATYWLILSSIAAFLLPGGDGLPRGRVNHLRRYIAGISGGAGITSVWLPSRCTFTAMRRICIVPSGERIRRSDPGAEMARAIRRYHGPTSSEPASIRSSRRKRTARASRRPSCRCMDRCQRTPTSCGLKASFMIR